MSEHKAAEARAIREAHEERMANEKRRERAMFVALLAGIVFSGVPTNIFGEPIPREQEAVRIARDILAAAEQAEGATPTENSHG